MHVGGGPADDWRLAERLDAALALRTLAAENMGDFTPLCFQRVDPQRRHTLIPENSLDFRIEL
jgi:hypothetical protein